MPDNKNQPAQAKSTDDQPSDTEEYEEVEYEMPTWMIMKKLYKLKVKVARLEGMMEVMMHGNMSSSGHSGCSCECNSCGMGSRTDMCSCGCAGCSR